MFILYEALQHDGEMVMAPRGENKVIAATDGNISGGTGPKPAGGGFDMEQTSVLGS